MRRDSKSCCGRCFAPSFDGIPQFNRPHCEYIRVTMYEGAEPIQGLPVLGCTTTKKKSSVSGLWRIPAEREPTLVWSWRVVEVCVVTTHTPVIAFLFAMGQAPCQMAMARIQAEQLFFCGKHGKAFPFVGIRSGTQGPCLGTTKMGIVRGYSVGTWVLSRSTFYGPTSYSPISKYLFFFGGGVDMFSEHLVFQHRCILLSQGLPSYPIIPCYFFSSKQEFLASKHPT